MLELVTIAEARSHLRVDAGTPDDTWLAIFIPAISESVANWLKDAWRLYEPEVDSAGDPILDSNGDQVPALDSDGYTVRFLVKAAVLIELAWQYRFREGDAEQTATGDLYSGRYGYTLSRGATAILGSLRKPTLA